MNEKAYKTMTNVGAVSYTHLDVYKRQAMEMLNTNLDLNIKYYVSIDVYKRQRFYRRG